MTEVEIAQHKMLAALMLEHHLDSGTAKNLTRLNREYNIHMPDHWVASSLSPWQRAGWVHVKKTRRGGYGNILPERYTDVLQKVLSWVGAGSLRVHVKQRTIVSDIAPPQVFPYNDEWTWWQLTDDKPIPEHLSAAENVPDVVSLPSDDPILSQVRADLSIAIERARGENQNLENREQVLTALRHAESLLGRSELAYMQLKVGVVLALEDAVQCAGKWAHTALIETVKACIVDWTRRTLGI